MTFLAGFLTGIVVLGLVYTIQRKWTIVERQPAPMIDRRHRDRNGDDPPRERRA